MGQANIRETVKRLGIVWMFSLMDGLVGAGGFSWRPLCESSWTCKTRHDENCRAEDFERVELRLGVQGMNLIMLRLGCINVEFVERQRRIGDS